MDDTGGVLWQQQRTPLMECFWQGRLIPGTRIESLPFIEVPPDPVADQPPGNRYMTSMPPVCWLCQHCVSHG